LFTGDLRAKLGGGEEWEKKEAVNGPSLPEKSEIDFVARREGSRFCGLRGGEKNSGGETGRFRREKESLPRKREVSRTDEFVGPQKAKSLQGGGRNPAEEDHGKKYYCEKHCRR